MGKTIPEYLLSCDWGTTSFRLWLFSSVSDRIVAGITASEGIAAAHDRWNKEPDRPRLPFYQDVLRKFIGELSQKAGFSLENVPLVISGMASSSIGISELPYAAVPFPLDGSGAATAKLGASADFPHETLLISGLKSERDVMRGEETQLLGLAAKGVLQGIGEAICLFPGTHSKHIRVRDHVLAGFKTYMTGEFFHLLSHHSILRDSLEEPAGQSKPSDPRETPGRRETPGPREILSPEAAGAFLEGLCHPEGADLLHAAFSIRTGYLFGKRGKAANFHFLSGLLIGAELNVLRNEKAATVVLCGGGNLSALYALALRQPGMPEQLIVVPPGTVDLSAVHGHRVLYERYTGVRRGDYNGL